MRRPKANLVFALAALIAFPACTRRLLYAGTQVREEKLAALAGEGWRAATLENGDIALNGLVRPPADGSAPWILYFGGNATALDGSAWVLDRLRAGEDVGLAVFAYRGYDGSEGRPTQRRLVADGIAAVKELEKRGADRSRLVLVGQSLGSAVAMQVAAGLQEEGRAPAALVLVSPFTSIPAVAREHVVCAPSCLFPDRWKTIRRAPALRMPVLVLHGTKDTVIPEEHGESVAAAIPGARFVPVPGRGHNDIWTRDALAAVRSFVLEQAR